MSQEQTQFYTLLTKQALAKLTRAKANNTPITLSTMAISDSQEAISDEATQLNDIKYTLQINSVTQHEQDPNILIVEGIIPANVGGFNVRQVGVFDNEGGLFAISKVTPIYKPQLTDGQGTQLSITLYIVADNKAKIILNLNNQTFITNDNFNSQIAKFKANVYTIPQSDEIFLTKAEAERIYLKIVDLIDSYTKAQSDERYLTKQNALPAGTIITSACINPPQGFLKCNGQSLSRSEYYGLFQAIGTTFGSTDENSFNVPDLRGQFVRGFKDDKAGIDDGRVFGSAQSDEFKRHSHRYPFTFPATDPYIQRYFNSLSSHAVLFALGKDQNHHDNVWAKFDDTSAIGGNNSYEGTANETRPKNIALSFFIKY